MDLIAHFPQLSNLLMADSSAHGEQALPMTQTISLLSGPGVLHLQLCYCSGFDWTKELRYASFNSMICRCSTEYRATVTLGIEF